MAKDLNLDVETILNKEFEVEFKGYSPIEVDQFLDLVVKDYDSYNQTIEELQQKVETFQATIDNLKTKIIDLESKLKDAETKSANDNVTPMVANLSQVDILRRIARLEQEVFNHK
jgi:DivIVA domain-containing protein